MRFQKKCLFCANVLGRRTGISHSKIFNLSYMNSGVVSANTTFPPADPLHSRLLSFFHAIIIRNAHTRNGPVHSTVDFFSVVRIRDNHFSRSGARTPLFERRPVVEYSRAHIIFYIRRDTCTPINYVHHPLARAHSGADVSAKKDRKEQTNRNKQIKSTRWTREPWSGAGRALRFRCSAVHWTRRVLYRSFASRPSFAFFQGALDSLGPAVYLLCTTPWFDLAKLLLLFARGFLRPLGHPGLRMALSLVLCCVVFFFISHLANFDSWKNTGL